jgi:hypothetical protein
MHLPPYALDLLSYAGLLVRDPVPLKTRQLREQSEEIDRPWLPPSHVNQYWRSNAEHTESTENYNLGASVIAALKAPFAMV